MLDEALRSYLARLHATQDPLLEELHARAQAERFPIVGPEVGRLLRMLTRAISGRTVFELGSGFGYSAWWFAEAVGPNGTVHLTDRSAERLGQAEDYLGRAGLWDRCIAHCGDALECFRAFEGTADVVFMDIDKAEYPDALPLLDGRLRRGGLLFVDNVLWSGRVWSGDDSPATRGILELTRALAGDPRYEPVVLPVRDGVLVALRVE